MLSHCTIHKGHPYVPPSLHDDICGGGPRNVLRGSCSRDVVCWCVPLALARHKQEVDGNARRPVIVTERIIIEDFCVLDAKLLASIHPVNGLHESENTVVPAIHVVPIKHVRTVEPETGDAVRDRRWVKYGTLFLGEEKCHHTKTNASEVGK